MANANDAATLPLIPGTKLGPFTSTDAIGAGGMGEGYRAQDERLDRDVALKFVLGSVLADRERVLRFEREARTLAGAINHPNCTRAIHSR